MLRVKYWNEKLIRVTPCTFLYLIQTKRDLPNPETSVVVEYYCCQSSALQCLQSENEYFTCMDRVLSPAQCWEELSCDLSRSESTNCPHPDQTILRAASAECQWWWQRTSRYTDDKSAPPAQPAQVWSLSWSPMTPASYLKHPAITHQSRSP